MRFNRAVVRRLIDGGMRDAYHRKDIESKNDQVAVVRDDGRKYVAYCVAGSNDVPDWVDNFFAWFKWFTLGVIIVCGHKRWMKRSIKLSEALAPSIKEYRDKGYTIIILGHSLGGAVAQNCFLIVDADYCFTFNSPLPWRRFKNQDQIDKLKSRIHHFLNTADITRRVPPWGRRLGKEYPLHVNRLFREDHTDINAMYQIADTYFEE